MSTEHWALAGLNAAVRFAVEADADPSLLPRLLQPFARRDLTPHGVAARRVDDRMRVEITLAAMPAEAVHVVAGNLRAVIGVRAVTVRQEVTGLVQRRAA